MKPTDRKGRQHVVAECIECGQPTRGSKEFPACLVDTTSMMPGGLEPFRALSGRSHCHNAPISYNIKTK